MPILDVRRRTSTLFVTVVLGQLILISAQVNSKSGVPLLEALTFGFFAEVQRSVATAVSGVRQVWDNYVGLRGVRADNEELTRRLAAAEIELQQQRALAARSRSLEQLLDLRDRSTMRTVAAQIIGGAATPDFRALTLDKGTQDGLVRDMAVIAPAGVVGRVVMPSARAAKVQLLIDRNAAAGALIERSRAQGVVVGNGDDRLRLEYVSEASDLVVGDVVVTSGIDGIFPKGFVIGHIETVEKTGPAYKLIIVRPAVDFSNLEDVLVVLTPNAASDAAARGSE